MNKILLFLAMLFLTSAAIGQSTPYSQEAYYRKGYIFMKNGSVLKGKYRYAPAMDKIRVISGQNSWVFDATEVEKISSKAPRPVYEPDTTFSSYVYQDSKWFNISELGIMVGDPNDSQSAPMAFSSSLYRQAWKNIYAGAGIGLEFYKESYLPVSVSLLYKLRNSRFTPIAVLKGGYAVPVGESRSVYYDVVPSNIYRSDLIWQGTSQSQSNLDAKGGFLIEPSLGFVRQTPSGLGFTMSFGYRFHRLNYTGENDYRLFIDYNRFLIKLGFTIQ
ncbi:MAG TPA: hypothetical protein PLW67_02710 [Prolixibacteraceae bacterium]|nr:hypothetical protein [Prolixibacteraceae bacterium]